MKIRNALNLRNAIGLGALITVISIGYFMGKRSAYLPAMLAYFQLLEAVKNASFHQLSADELKKFHECVLQKAFISITIPKNFILYREVKIPSCLEHDPYAWYLSPSQTRQRNKLQERQADVRKEMKFRSVETETIGSGIGYLKIKEFSKPVLTEDVLPVLDRLQQDGEGLRGLILDLRDNPGGLVLAAREVLELFSPAAGTLMVEIKQRNGRVLQRLVTGQKGKYSNLKLAVLVNGRSGSASEMVAGVLQIWGAKIFGVKTRGKGSAIQPYPLSDGGMLFFTYARYYFVNGKSPEQNGIRPDEAEQNPSLQLKKAAEHIRNELRK